MITVGQYDYIRTAYRVYGKKIKEIARETGHSKNTVKKALRQEYVGYSQREYQPYPSLGPFLKIIDKWLENDKQMPKKQRHTATRIYNRLKQDHGYTGGDSTVRRYAREAKLRIGIGISKAFIPCDPPVGREAEVDWGTCIAILNGKKTRLKLFCIRSKYSGKHFVRCYPCERQQAFFDAHIQAFYFFKGIFPVLIYDNLKTAVQKVLKGKKRVQQKEYSKFVAYYNFTPRFCNRASGHEKGGVEGLVGYARRNYMVPVPEADSLEQLNEKLLQECLSYGEHRISGKEKTVNELYETEKHHLLKLPDIEFSNIQTYSGKANKYSTINIDKNRYSVPTDYALCKVRAVLYVDNIKIYYNNRKVASHQRLFNVNQWSLDPSHYLKLIQQRPFAFDNARPIKQWRKKWPDCYERLLSQFCRKQGDTNGTRDFINVLMLHSKYNTEAIKKAIEQALEINTSCSQTVLHILQCSIKTEDTVFMPLENWERLPAPDISEYDQIGGAI